MPLTSLDVLVLYTVWSFVFLVTGGLLWPWRDRGVVPSADGWSDETIRQRRELGLPLAIGDTRGVDGKIGARRRRREADRRRYDLGAGQ